MNSIDTRPRNHYDELEVSRAASPEVLRAAYKSLIQRYHPDRNPGDALAARRSALVIKAYQVLSDPVQRAVYDLELKRQSGGLRQLDGRRNDLPIAAASRADRKSLQWLYWAPFVLLGFFLWFFWTEFQKSSAVDIGQPASGPSRGSPSAMAIDQKPPPAAKAIPDYIANLSVPLAPRGSPGGGAHSAVTHVLSIKSIGVVVGSFDSDKYIDLLNGSREYVARKLSERLAFADYEQLVQYDGDRYLKQLILASIGEITNTRQLAQDSAAGRALASHYGAVEILLPAAFSVESRQPSQVTVQVLTTR